MGACFLFPEAEEENEVEKRAVKTWALGCRRSGDQLHDLKGLERVGMCHRVGVPLHVSCYLRHENLHESDPRVYQPSDLLEE